jgi:hypothetical protein
VAKELPSGHTRIPQHEGVEWTVQCRRGPSGQRGTEAHADHRHLGHPGGAHHLHCLGDAAGPGLDPVRVVEGADRITGPVVGEPEDRVSGAGEGLGQLSKGQIGTSLLVPDRRAEHDAVPGPVHRLVEQPEQRALARTEPDRAGGDRPAHDRRAGVSALEAETHRWHLGRAGLIGRDPSSVAAPFSHCVYRHHRRRD